MEETAYHECGHAFMAVHLGGQIRSLTIEPDQDDGPDRFGEVQVAWDRSCMTVKEFQNKLVLVALAGPVTEMIYTGDPLHPGFVVEWKADWEAAWEAAEPVLGNERKRLVFLEEATRQLYALLHQDRHWAVIAALADNLLAYETLEADEVRNVLAAWMR